MSASLRQLMLAGGVDGVHAWIGALWFFLVVVVLDFFDITMPRGDSIAVSGALCGAAIVLLGPIPAIPVALVSAVVSQVARRERRADRIWASLLARLLAIGFGWLVLYALEGAKGRTTYYFACALLVPAAYLLGELAVIQITVSIRTRRPALRLLTGNLNRQAPLLAAQVSVAALTIVTYPDMKGWSLIPVVALLLLMRQSYALLLDIRETYRNTVEVLVEAAEGQDQRRSGHSERTAAIARSIGQKVGLSSSQVELLSYAALLHDIDAIAGDVDAMEDPGSASSVAGVGRSSAVFEGVDFFANVVPILTLCDGDPDSAASASEGSLLGALIVALASDADVADNPELERIHGCGAVARVSPFVSSEVKARAVAAAVSLGYKIPAVS